MKTIPGLPKTLTRVWLNRVGACENQKDLFSRTFGPRGMRVTRNNLLSAARAGLQIDWLLDEPSRRIKASARRRIVILYGRKVRPEIGRLVEHCSNVRDAAVLQINGLSGCNHRVESKNHLDRLYREIREQAWRTFQLLIAHKIADTYGLK